MRKIIYYAIALVALAAAAETALAIPAKRGTFTYTQPDGSTIVLQRVGDERMHATLDASGNPMVMDENGFYVRATVATRSGDAPSPVVRTHLGARRKVAPATDMTIGTRYIPVLLVEFSDKKFKVSDPQGKFNDLLNQEGYSYNGATGSVHDFYYDNSHGLFDPKFDVQRVVSLSNKMSHYGSSDEDVVLAIMEASDSLSKDGIDFSKYDSNSDGVVDMLLIYYAGNNEAEGGSSSTIWPHQWEVSSYDAYYNTSYSKRKYNGVTLDKYFCTSELQSGGSLCGIGTTCHEFGHSLGLPDFYDSNYADDELLSSWPSYSRDTHSMDSFSTMDSGSYLNNGRTPPYFTTEERIMLGWIGEDAIEEVNSTRTVTIPSVYEGKAYKLSTSEEGEYFLFECRDGSGWDAYLPTGCTVTHIDKTKNRTLQYPEVVQNGWNSSINYIPVTPFFLWDQWEVYNAINAIKGHPCSYLIYPSDPSNYNKSSYNLNEWVFPGSGVSSYRPTDWNGVENDIIAETISYAEGIVTISFRAPEPVLTLYNEIVNPKNGKYSLGDEFVFELDRATLDRVPATVSWYFDDELVTDSYKVLSVPGLHTVEAVLGLENGKTKKVSLEITVE